MYSYSILKSTGLTTVPHSENIDEAALKKIEGALPVKLDEGLLESICSLVQSVSKKAIRIKQKKNSALVISTPQNKRAFISLHKKLATQGAQGISHKLALMLEFDASAHFVQAKEVVVLKSAWKEEEGLNFSSLERRVSIMQQLKKSEYFPENYGFVFTKGKEGKMIRIYQEKANGDLFDYQDQQCKLHELSDAEKEMLAKNLIFALCDMQEASIIHRDIKLENILAYFSTEALENIKFTDLGLACLLEDKDTLKASSGTMGWIPPEVFEEIFFNKPSPAIGFHTDIWAVGLILHLLVHETPHETQALYFQIDTDTKTIRWANEALNLLFDLDQTKEHVQDLTENYTDIELKEKRKELVKTFIATQDTPSLLKLQRVINRIDEALAIDKKRSRLGLLLTALEVPSELEDPTDFINEALQEAQASKEEALEKWKQAIETLPKAPVTLSSLQDLATAMLQRDPNARITAQQAKEALLAFLSTPAIKTCKKEPQKSHPPELKFPLPPPE